MKRVHRSLLTAAILLVGGGGGALYLYQTQVRTSDARFIEREEAKRPFHFGRLQVASGRLEAKNATFSFARDSVFTWRITEPIDWPADVEAIDAMLNRMSAIKMDPVLTEAASDEDRTKNGLDRPHTRLSVRVGDDEHVLLVGTKNKIVDKFPITDANKLRIGLSEPSFYWAFDRDLFAFRSRRLFPFDADAIQAVEIKGGGGEMRARISRSNGSEREFEVSGGSTGGTVPGDIGEIDLFLVALTKRLTAERIVTDAMKPAEAAKFGLTQPRLSIRVQTSDETVRNVVFSKGEELVAHVEGTRTVAAVDEALLEDLDRTAETFRDRSIARYDPRDVHRMRVTIGASTPFSLERSDDGSDWTVVEPVKKPAKVWRVDNLLLVYSKLKAIRIYRHDPTKAELKEWVLEPPSRRLELFDAEGELLTDLRLGKYATEEEIFAMTASQDRVGVIADSKLKVFPANVNDLVDPDRSMVQDAP